MYLDSSAVVKLLVREPGSKDLRSYLRARSVRIASRIVDVEVLRAIARVPGLDLGDRPRRILARITKVEIDATLAASAGRVASPSLRTLDAIHLASALSIGDQLEALVTYDTRLADAARSLGIAVVSPGV